MDSTTVVVFPVPGGPWMIANVLGLQRQFHGSALRFVELHREPTLLFHKLNELGRPFSEQDAAQLREPIATRGIGAMQRVLLALARDLIGR